VTSIRNLLLTKFRFKNHAHKKEWEEIEKIKKELMDLGFFAGEVEYMVESTFKHKKNSEITLEEIKAGKESLKGQMEISQKCLKLVHVNFSEAREDKEEK
jgi:hypothetical protein